MLDWKKEPHSATNRYARCIETSKRVRWEIETDIIRGRKFNTDHKYLPDGLSFVNELGFLSISEQKYLSQIQGRTYANIFGLVERFINAKVLELSSEYWLGDQVALEALVRFSDEELKHQAMFRLIEEMISKAMPEGYTNTPNPDAVAEAVLSKGTWAVLLLVLHIELFTQSHYRESISPTEDLSPLFKDVFLYHWKEESQHAILDELELLKFDATMSEADRDQGVTEFIELVGAVDGILQAQAIADAEYFAKTCGRTLDVDDAKAVEAGLLKAYRWQYILSGAQHHHFQKILTGLLNEAQLNRVVEAIVPLQQ